MSSEKVKQFLEEKKNSGIIKNEEDTAQLKYKILSHYNLGEVVYYKEGDNPDDYPFTNSGFKFKYVCDITDEDYEKLKEIYYKENPKANNETNHEINKGAEKTLNVCANIILILGILAFIILTVLAFNGQHHYYGYYGVTVRRFFDWSSFVMGIVILFSSIANSALLKVIANISHKLDKLG